MALSMSTTLAIYIVSQCLLLQISITESENVSVSFKLDGKNRVRLDGDAFVTAKNVIQLTNSTIGLNGRSAGRVVYENPIPLWSALSKSFANFTTHFQFQINLTGKGDGGTGGGLAFFMASPDSGFDFPYRGDGYLSNQPVAVEFDTYSNHIGIDVNSTTSEASVPLEQRLNNSKIWFATIDYHGNENMLKVSAGTEGQVAGHLSYERDLTKYLPENVMVGFSASAFGSSEIHRLISWNFTSVISGLSSEKRKFSQSSDFAVPPDSGSTDIPR